MSGQKTLSRAAFDALPAADRATYVRGGGKVFDPDPPKLSLVNLPEGTITRDSFDKLIQRDRAAFVRAGGKVVDS